MDYVTILGQRIDLYTKEEILDVIGQTIVSKQKKIFLYLNAHGSNLAVKYSWLSEFYDKADVVYADGKGIQFASRILSGKAPPHLPLTEWIWGLLRQCSEKKQSIYLLGGSEEVIYEATQHLKSQNSNLLIAGSHHGYFRKSGSESEEVVRQINSVTPDILLVGFGMPAQEEWLNENFSSLQIHVAMTIGGAIDVLAGRRRNVPAFVRNIGLEWLFRLFEEPKRLFVRYIFGNPKFAARVIVEKFKSKNAKGKSKP